MLIRDRSDRRLQPGQASKYINSVDEIKPGDKLVLACRVSSWKQNKSKNLADAEANLRQRARDLGASVVDVVTFVGSGRDPFWLVRAARIARKNDAKIFAETTDRLIRSPLYGKYDQDFQARDCDLQKVKLFTKRVTLITDLHPDACPGDSRSYEIKRGQKAKGNRGGRPPKSKLPQKEKRLLDAVWNRYNTLPPRVGQKGLEKRPKKTQSQSAIPEAIHTPV